MKKLIIALMAALGLTFGASAQTFNLTEGLDPLVAGPQGAGSFRGVILRATQEVAIGAATIQLGGNTSVDFAINRLDSEPGPNSFVVLGETLASSSQNINIPTGVSPVTFFFLPVVLDIGDIIHLNFAFGSSDPLQSFFSEPVRGAIPLNFRNVGPFDLVNSTFNLGVANFALNEISVTVQSVSAVPEPATWLMMIIGFAGVGLVSRRRRTIELA